MSSAAEIAPATADAFRPERATSHPLVQASLQGPAASYPFQKGFQFCESAPARASGKLGRDTFEKIGGKLFGHGAIWRIRQYCANRLLPFGAISNLTRQK
jgi:hypothetical protein